MKTEIGLNLMGKYSFALSDYSIHKWRSHNHALRVGSTRPAIINSGPPMRKPMVDATLTSNS